MTEETLENIILGHISKELKDEIQIGRQVNLAKTIMQALRIHDVVGRSCVVVREDCPDGYWYSNQKGKQFNIKTCHYSDLREVEGFGNKEPIECWKVADGEFAGNVVLKQHCL